MKCDRARDCLDGKDEENCDFNYPCPEGTCQNGDCIFYSQRCDGRSDCYDGSDEQNC